MQVTSKNYKKEREKAKKSGKSDRTKALFHKIVGNLGINADNTNVENILYYFKGKTNIEYKIQRGEKL
jgi:hypothetical protein